MHIKGHCKLVNSIYYNESDILPNLTLGDVTPRIITELVGDAKAWLRVLEHKMNDEERAAEMV